MNRVGADDNIVVEYFDIDDVKIMNVLHVMAELVEIDGLGRTSDGKVSRGAVCDLESDMRGQDKLTVMPLNSNLSKRLVLLLPDCGREAHPLVLDIEIVPLDVC